jgi:hypothetical protein
MTGRILSFIFGVVLLLPVAGLAEDANLLEGKPIISFYQATFRPVSTQTGQLRIAIRQFSRNGANYWLLVHPDSLETEILPEWLLDFTRRTPEWAWRRTPYIKALTKHTAAPFSLFNDGITRAEHGVPGFFLTIDLCPSVRPLEKNFIGNVVGLPQSQKGPVPIAIALAGLWANQHPDDLEWLQAQSKAGRLAITWINHSYSHPFDKTQPNNRTFLLTPGIDLNSEILTTERLMLEKGLLPSPFFRFPGLISDQNLMQAIARLGLIPIGNDTWLGLGETPQPGNIMLVHGMGSETEDIGLALSFYEQYKQQFNNGSLSLLPLKMAFSGVGATMP